jgi:hypothetical protein
MNKGRGSCGLSELRYKHSWSIDDVNCLRCLKNYISLRLEVPYQHYGEERYKQVKYDREFDKLLK